MVLAYPLSDLTELPTQCYLVTMKLRLTGGQLHPLLFPNYVLFLIRKCKTEDERYKYVNLTAGGTPKTQELIQDRRRC